MHLKNNTRRIETPDHIVPIQELQEVPLSNLGQIAAVTSPDLARMEVVQRHVLAVEVADLFNVQIRVVEDKSN